MSDTVVQFDRRMLEALICPRSQQTLSYDAERSWCQNLRALLILYAMASP